MDPRIFDKGIDIQQLFADEFAGMDPAQIQATKKNRLNDLQYHFGNYGGAADPVEYTRRASVLDRRAREAEQAWQATMAANIPPVVPMPRPAGRDPLQSVIGALNQAAPPAPAPIAPGPATGDMGGMLQAIIAALIGGGGRQ